MSLRVFALCATLLSVPLPCVEAQENGVVRFNIVKSDLSTPGKEASRSGSTSALADLRQITGIQAKR
jgi:hypothetical protein